MYGFVALVYCLNYRSTIIVSEEISSHQLSTKQRSPYLSQKLNFQRPGLKIAHIHVNGLLLSKLLDIKVLLSLLKFDILAITESRLNQSISKNEIGTAGYKIARCSGNNGCKGGGSIIDFI